MTSLLLFLEGYDPTGNVIRRASSPAPCRNFLHAVVHVGFKDLHAHSGSAFPVSVDVHDAVGFSKLGKLLNKYRPAQLSFHSPTPRVVPDAAPGAPTFGAGAVPRTICPANAGTSKVDVISPCLTQVRAFRTQLTTPRAASECAA